MTPQRVAQQFLATYPTPKALREALRATPLAELIPIILLDVVRYDDGTPIRADIESPTLALHQAHAIHACLTGFAVYGPG